MDGQPERLAHRGGGQASGGGHPRAPLALCRALPRGDEDSSALARATGALDAGRGGTRRENGLGEEGVKSPPSEVVGVTCYYCHSEAVPQRFVGWSGGGVGTPTAAGMVVAPIFAGGGRRGRCDDRKADITGDRRGVGW